MKPITPHDPLDDLIAAALHGDLSPAERAQFESRLATDPAAQAAYQEAQAMHDLLEKTHQSAQPDAAFEQRMVSAVRRKLSADQHRETAWESVLIVWRAVKSVRRYRPSIGAFLFVACTVLLLAGVALGPITAGIKKASQPVGVFSTITNQLAVAGAAGEIHGMQTRPSIMEGNKPLVPPSSTTARITALDRLEQHYQTQLRSDPYNKNAADHLARIEKQKQVLVMDAENAKELSPVNHMWNEAVPSGKPASLSGANTYTGGTTVSAGALTINSGVTTSAGPTPQGGTIRGAPFGTQAQSNLADTDSSAVSTPSGPAVPVDAPAATLPDALKSEKAKEEQSNNFNVNGVKVALAKPEVASTPPPPAPAATTPAIDDRKLIRNAQLELEVKSYQSAVDQITGLARAAGGYVDTSTSQRGGNGKLQGTMVVKVLPQNLDPFLMKLRELGEVQNQSVSTDDVTKAYFDTQARLVNSQKMEAQLQELLKRENGKVSDLLAVERELGRVRGDIEQMQGQLKLYDFQVEYATVTMQIAEKDLKQTAAYLLEEHDDFSLFATDVEATFQTARKTADDFKAQVLIANLNHNSGSDVSAQLTVSVPPDQIEPFLAQIRGLGRVANFTRDTKRTAKDGGDSSQPADQTLTEKDKVMVTVMIRSDDESRERVALTVVTKTVDEALDQAKAAALAQAGTAILGSSLNKQPQGQSTAQLAVRVPGKEYAALMEAFRALGRPAALSVQRNDNAGPGAKADDAPVIVSLALTDDDTPIQTTDVSVRGDDVDGQSQQIKKDAAAAGVEVKSSTFEQQPDGTELAQMTFRMPMAKYMAFLESIKKLGKVESLSVNRTDRPDQGVSDDTAPVEISLQLHNERDIVPESTGLFATLRQTFGEGAGALFASVRIIGVLLAFILPWVVAFVVIAWIARRIYIWRKK